MTTYPYVSYLSSPFPEFSIITNDRPQTILTASAHTLFVNGLMICNRTPAAMQFNLQKKRIQSLSDVTIFYINEYEIPAYGVVDVIADLGLQIFLQYQTTPTAISDSLICFSNGYTQVFDCEISYTQLNET